METVYDEDKFKLLTKTLDSNNHLILLNYSCRNHTHRNVLEKIVDATRKLASECITSLWPRPGADLYDWVLVSGWCGNVLYDFISACLGLLNSPLSDQVLYRASALAIGQSLAPDYRRKVQTKYKKPENIKVYVMHWQTWYFNCWFKF